MSGCRREVENVVAMEAGIQNLVSLPGSLLAFLLVFGARQCIFSSFQLGDLLVGGSRSPF
jgi:hypothetical protein